MSNIIELIKKLPHEKRAVLEQQLLVDGSKYNVFPLSFAQKRLWFLDRFEANKAVYNIPSAYKIIGDLDINVLENSIREIIKRHEILRTTIVVVDQEPFQVIHDDLSLSIPIIDLSFNNDNKKLKNILTQEATQHFDLSKGPLLSIKVIRLEKDEHIISLIMHHIISDGWSMSILIGEVIALYNAFKKNQESPFPPLEIQYADYAKWQENFLQSEKYEKQLAYWKDKLDDLPKVLELPTDKPRASHQTHNGNHKKFKLSKELSTTLVKLSRKYNVTLFMLLLSAFKVLLHKYTGQDDISVGTPIAGRNNSSTEKLIGFFINTLVLRTNLSENPNFTEILQSVKETALGAFANQDTPFEKLVEIIQPERDLSVPPLFQVLFTLQNMPSQKVEVSDLIFEPVAMDSNTVKYDLTLSIAEASDGIEGGVGYNTDLFEDDTIDRFINHFKVILQNISENEQLRVSEINLISEDEHNKIVIEWNKIEKNFRGPKTIHQLFQEQVLKTPDNTAVVQPNGFEGNFDYRKITYSQLDGLSNKISSYIYHKLNLQKNIVVICLDRSVEQIASVFGILKSGNAYLPIDINYPEERIAFMIKDSGASIVITQVKYKEKFKKLNTKVIVIEDEWRKIQTQDVSEEQFGIMPNDLAYIIYTSGSTGKPKGVEITHKNLVNYIYAAKEKFNLKPSDKLLQFASISFDAAAEEIYPALSSGASLVLRTDTMIGSTLSFIKSIEEFGITVLDLPTAYWHQMISGIEETHISFPPNIRLAIIGGERAIPEYVLKWQNLFPNVKLLNTYGPTETTVVATVWELPDKSGNPAFLKEVPIGKPIPNVKVYILDKYLQPVPIGVPGELAISGEGVAKGYLNRPSLTAEKFLPNHFDKSGSSRLYLTGDKVKYLADGNIEYLGRIDQQVKIRGFRIELGEIDNEINRHPKVKNAVIRIKEREKGDKAIIAYFVPKEDTKLNSTELREFLQKELPDYMIPAYFVKLNKISLTSSGKIDFKQLPDPTGVRQETDKLFIEAKRPLEKILSEMWKRTLKIDKISINDNFFELGGDSLKAAVLINRLQQELGIILYVVVLFDTQTISKLSKYLEQNYPDAVIYLCEKYFPNEKYDIRTKNISVSKALITEEKIELMKEILSQSTEDIEKEKQFIANKESKIKKTIFILSAPRSGSTLLRVILAGHSKLFSPPELALLNFRTLKERTETFTGRDEGWMEGLHRAIMEIKKCDFAESKNIVNEFERLNYTTRQMYEKLQEWIGDKILVDKTTTYATNIDYLKRAEGFFKDAFYIQIVRHPAAMIQSYLDSSLDQVFGSGIPISAREKAEIFWYINNQNINEFFTTVPSERKIVIRYEDLVRYPKEVISKICDKLNLEFEEEMIHPYSNNRMLDGVHKESKMVGDPRFHTHKKIDSSLADKWQTLPDGDKLNYLTIRASEKFNYKINSNDREVHELSIQIVPREKLLPLSFSQERLWFLDKLDSNNSAYNIPGVVKLKGKLNLEILNKTIQTIVDRHEILRSSINTVEGKGYISVINNLTINIKLKELKSDEISGQKIAEIVTEEIRKPFELSEIPLFRIKIFKINELEHIFVLTMHHIISDGWSVGVFIKEFSEIYSSLFRQQEPRLASLKIQYIDYAYWQREHLKGDILAEQLNYWKNYLEGAPQLLELPTDKPRPAIQTFNGTIKKFKIPDELSGKINMYCKYVNVTPFMFLLTVFQILLSKYSKQNDICTGIPIANRNRAEFENLIGFFVNTIVIRNRINVNEEFSELIKQIKKSVVSVFAHQDIPFEKVVDSLDVERNVSHSPLFQVMFTYQNLPKSKIELPNLELEAVELESNISKFDLSLTMMEGKNGFMGGFEYNTDLFEPGTIERMIKHFKIILNELITHPSKKINEVQIISEKEKHILLNNWNNTVYNHDDKVSLPQMFERAAEKYKSNKAVNYNNQTITYEELNTKSNHLANYLIEKGVTPDSLVGYYLERSIECIVSIIAIWKAGAAYVPLDPSYPKERIEYMIDNSGISNLITLEKHKNIISDKDINLILMDDDKGAKNLNDNNPVVKVHPDNLAYIIYTSGSTGKPKGVMIRHKSVLNLANELAGKIYGKKENLKVSLNAPLAFDASVQQLVALFYGHTLFIIPQETRLDGEGLLNFIVENKLDVLDCVPTQLKILLDQGFAQEGKHRPTIVLPGGEPIDNKMWNTLLHIKDVNFYNMYGPTECTVDSTICRINEKITKPSIGRPITNVTHYVLDDSLNLLPIGIPGELYIGGDGLVRGYLNKPVLTAQRFIPNPFSNRGGERLYKTGDLVRYLPDGNIEYIGRIDNQVKLRGFRIELGEIESILNSHNDIEQSVVIIREDQPNTKKLVTYFVTNNSEFKNEELEEYLSGTLPDYMIPSFFVKLDKIPLTPNGKIDKRALPEPKLSDTISIEEFIVPKTGKEIILAEVWNEVLGFEKIGANDNFFKLGGDSIVAIQMIAKAKQKGLQITPVQIFQNQTLQKLAMVAKEVEIVTAKQGMVTGISPLIPIQKYFFEHKFSEPNHWNQSIFLKINESLDEDKLRESIKVLILHHDELRAEFENKNGSWQQNILEPSEVVPFEVVDLTSTDSNSIKQIIEEHNARYQASLNIKDGRVIKIVYYKVGKSESRILIIVHHLVIDGISWRILIEDLITAYNLLLANKEVILPPKSTSFKTWAEFINEFADSEVIKKEKDYWLEQSERAINQIEKDFNKNENFERSLFNKSITLNKEETDYLLKGIHEVYNTQINDILLTALLAAYNKWKGKRKLLIHLEGHGREQLSLKYDISRTIGWFTSLFPLYLDMNDAVEIGDIIKLVKENLRRIPNKGIGYGILKYLSSDSKLKDKLKVFDDAQITFNYLGQFDQSVPENSPFVIATESKGPDRGLSNIRTSLIDTTAVVSQGTMSISISANKNQFKEESIIEFLDDYKNALQDIINHCKGTDNVEYTSSDFDLVDLEDDQLSSVLDKLNNQDD